MSADRVWCSIKDKLGRPWGAALDPSLNGRICHPPLITEPTRMIRRRELRKAIDGASE